MDETSAMEEEAGEASVVAARQLEAYPQAVAPLAAALRALDPSVVVTCARGSSDHAATFAKYLIETRTGVPTASHAPSTTSVYGTGWRRLDRAFYLTISQSGQSPDLILSSTAARAAGACVAAFVNDAGSPLTAAAGHVVPLLAGAETSVAATKSYIASLLAVAHLVARWQGDEALLASLAEAPACLEAAWALDWSAAAPTLAAASSVFVIGRGMSLGIAQEAALKLKETSGLHAEAFSAAEVQHGPMALVGKGFPVLMLLPADRARDAFSPLAADFVARGARVFVAGGELPGTTTLPVVPGSHPVLAPIALIQSFYRLAAVVSRARGLDPDRPPHLRKVTETR